MVALKSRADGGQRVVCAQPSGIEKLKWTYNHFELESFAEICRVDDFSHAPSSLGEDFGMQPAARVAPHAADRGWHTPTPHESAREHLFKHQRDAIQWCMQYKRTCVQRLRVRTAHADLPEPQQAAWGRRSPGDAALQRRQPVVGTREPPRTRRHHC